MNISCLRSDEVAEAEADHRMTPLTPEASGFHTTRWTRVCMAKVESDDGRRALSELCEVYYDAVVAFLRCELRDADAAREMSHAFFEQMLMGGRIRSADPTRGRFRAYLLGSVKHFVSHHREAATRRKRGGGQPDAPLEAAESMPDSTLTPDAAFDRQWALTVLARGLDALQAKCEAEGKAEFFSHAKPLLTGEAAHGVQEEIAAACGMSVAALRMALSRLRHRLRDCVKAEVAGTLDDPALIQEEMRVLFAAL